MKTKYTKVATLAAILIIYGSFAKKANGALTISISEDMNGNAVVTWEGVNFTTNGLTEASSRFIGRNTGNFIYDDRFGGGSYFTLVDSSYDFRSSGTGFSIPSFATGVSIADASISSTGVGSNGIRIDEAGFLSTNNSYTSSTNFIVSNTYDASIADLGIDPDFSFVATLSNGQVFSFLGSEVVPAEEQSTITYTDGEDRTDSIISITTTTTTTLELATGTATQSGVISGVGSIIKDGAGSLIFSGANTYTGNTSLVSGTLITDNLSGSLVQTGGTFSPGPSTATSTIGGNYSQSATSALSLEIGGTEAGTGHDALQIVGMADLSGTINITFTNGYSPSGGETFRVLSAGSLIDNGYTLNPPVLLSDSLVVEVSAASSYIEVSVDFAENIFGFRAEYELAEDGSEDLLDWSQNGIANIQYFAFGLGDPNEANVDRSRLPNLQNERAFGDYAVSFVRPKNDVGLNVSVETSADLTTGFTDLDRLGQSYQPVETETESLDETYDRITQHFDFVADENKRFYRMGVVVSQEPTE